MDTPELPFEDILRSISTHLEEESIIICKQTCTTWNNILSQKEYVDILEKYRKINSHLKMYPKMLIDALGETDKIITIPIYDIGERIGWTGYIDFIYREDMKYPVMRGLDSYGRSFLTLSYNLYYEDGKFMSNKVESFFQRYIDDSGVWTSGNTGQPSYLSLCRSRIDNECCNHIRDLIAGKRIKLTSWNNNFYAELSD